MRYSKETQIVFVLLIVVFVLTPNPSLISQQLSGYLNYLNF